MEIKIIILAVLGIAFIYIICRSSSISSRMEEDIRIRKEKNTNDPTLQAFQRKMRVMKSYFFEEGGRLSFSKFCDYVLCIRDDEKEHNYIEYLAELQLLVKCCDNMEEHLLKLLMEEKSIIALIGSSGEFALLQGYIRDGKFKGTFGDFGYILFSTVFYLKNKIRNNEQK